MPAAAASAIADRPVPVYERHDPARVVGRMSLDEYAAFERTAAERHEFLGGKVVRLAGGSPEHNLLCANTIRLLGNAVESAGIACDVLGSNQKIAIGDDLILYPDVVVAADPAQYDHRDALHNPLVIVEVLSPSTEREDHTDKFRDYQRLASLRHYVLIEQNRPSVTHYEKLAQGLWAIVGDHTDLADALRLTVDGTPLTLPLSAIYRRVSFPGAAAESGNP